MSALGLRIQSVDATHYARALYKVHPLAQLLIDTLEMLPLFEGRYENLRWINIREGVLSIVFRAYDTFERRLLAEEGMMLLEQRILDGGDLRIPLANNVFFALIELGDLEKAARIIPFLDSAFHTEAYPTASLGLYHMRKGHLERGSKLYEEAIALANKPSDKARIRQKLWLELAKRAAAADPRAAERYLTRVVKEKHGEHLLEKQAQQLLGRLTFRPKGG